MGSSSGWRLEHIKRSTNTALWKWDLFSYSSLLLLQALQLQSLNVLAFSTCNFQLLRSWMELVQFFIFSFFTSFLVSSSHLFFGLPIGLVNIGFHLYTFLTILSSDIQCKWPNQLNLCAFTCMSSLFLQVWNVCNWVLYSVVYSLFSIAVCNTDPSTSDSTRFWVLILLICGFDYFLILH